MFCQKFNKLVANVMRKVRCGTLSLVGIIVEMLTQKGIEFGEQFQNTKVIAITFSAHGFVVSAKS